MNKLTENQYDFICLTQGYFGVIVILLMGLKGWL